MPESSKKSSKSKFPVNAGAVTDPLATRSSINQDGLPMTVKPLARELAQPSRVKTGEDREDEHSAVIDRQRWFKEPRLYPNKDLPSDAPVKAFLQTLGTEQQAFAAQADTRLAPTSHWQLIGPGNFAGRVNSVAVDRNNTQRIYVCTSSAGVWRSTDGGVSWTDIGGTLGTNFTGIVAIDPNNSNVVYVATGDNNVGAWGVGLFKSTNMGNSFALTSLTGFQWAHAIIVHPTNSNIVWVATNAGLYRTTDAGGTWIRQFNGDINDLVLNPSNPNVLYCAKNADGIYKTTDGGTTWVRQNCGPAAGVSRWRIRLALCNGAPANVYASFDAGRVRIWRTSDSGATWSELPDVPDAGWGQLWYNHYIAVKPNNANVVYTGQGTIYRTLNGGAGGGVGAGKAWQEINAPVGAGYTWIHVDHHSLTFDPVNPNVIYCGCDGGVYRSRFGGNYWEYIGASIPSSEFYAIGQGNQEHYQVGGGTQDNGTWMTDGAYGWNHILGGDGFYFVVDPTNPNTIYAEWQGLNLNRSDNKGVNFGYKSGGIMEADPKPWMGIIELDANMPSRLYVGSDRIYRTDNRMDTWTRQSCGDNVVLISLTKGAASRIQIDAASTAAAALGLSGNVQGANNPDGSPATFARMLSAKRAPFALANGSTLKIRVDGGALQTVTFNAASFANIAAATAREVGLVIDAQTNNLHAAPSADWGFSAIKVAPSNSNVVYAAAGPQLWCSVNAGATWTKILKAPLPDRYITDLDVAANDFNRVYVTVSGWGTPHVFRSIDGGGTWEARSGGLPDTPANSIVIDTTNGNRMWVGTDSGIFASTDGGASWINYGQGLPRVVVTDLKLHRNTGLLRAGTYGRGIWERQATNLSLQISDVRTASQSAANVESFRHTQDALALVMDVAASADLVNLGLRYDAVWQIISAATNKVVREVWNNDQPFSFGQFFWISMGNNWGPTPNDFTTPQKWGIGPGLYQLRGAMLVRGTNTFAISTKRWFRVI